MRTLAGSYQRTPQNRVVRQWRQLQPVQYGLVDLDGRPCRSGTRLLGRARRSAETPAARARLSAGRLPAERLGPRARRAVADAGQAAGCRDRAREYRPQGSGADFTGADGAGHREESRAGAGRRALALLAAVMPWTLKGMYAVSPA